MANHLAVELAAPHHGSSTSMLKHFFFLFGLSTTAIAQTVTLVSLDAHYPFADGSQYSSVTTATFSYPNLGSQEPVGAFYFNGWNSESTIDLSQYLQVELTHSGSITFDTFTIRAACDRTPTLTLRSSVDGYTSDLAQWQLSSTLTLTNYSASLSSLGAVEDSITFRIYGTYGTNSPYVYIRKDGVDPTFLTITGTPSAVPEPGIYAAAAGCAALGVACRARRRKHG